MFSVRAKNVQKYVIPAILSQICFSLFSVIDGIFVGNGVGINALGAMNIVMPFVMAVCAIMMLINIGSVTIFAISIGKGDTDEANKVFRHGLFLLIVICAILSFVGIFFNDIICTLFGAGETFHQYATEYLLWYSIFIIPSGLSMGLQNFCRNDGAPGLVGVAVLVSTVCNIFGDWLLVFPLAMGMKGAAIATGVSQLIGLVIMLTHFIRKKGILRFGRTKLDGSLIRSIFTHGLPECISQLATPVTSLCMNLVLVAQIGDIGVNAFSVISYISSFFFGVLFGSGEGLQPLFGQCYGAKNEKDLKYYFKTGLLVNLGGSMLVILLVLILGRPICTLFGADAATLEYAVRIMPVYSVGFIVMGFNTMISAYLYSTERSLQSTVISVLRSVSVNAVIILILPAIFGSNVVWITFAIYEAVVLIAAVALLKHSERNGIVFK